MSTPPMQPYDSCVYFARCGRFVKIGFSSHPEHRIKTLFAGCTIIVPADLDKSDPVELLHLIPDCRIRDERILHTLFARHHAAGEWYHLTLPFLRQLASLRYQTDRARARHAFLVRAELKKARLHGRAA